MLFSRRLQKKIFFWGMVMAVVVFGNVGNASPVRVKAKARVCIFANDDNASPAGIAAQALRDGLSGLYSGWDFFVGQGADAKAAHFIFLGTPDRIKSMPGVSAAVKRLSGPESFVVTTAGDNTWRFGLILGHDERGILYGVYGLLRKLGYGYLLDEDTGPASRGRPFSFDAWDLADRPLVPNRFVFNWHNFLSGCSSWDLVHWNRWTTQAQKMGFNGIMVHAYGNNPMAGFSFKGLDKPVGYLSSTRIGRDWATMHVNDVRRLIGGHVFDGPVLGSTAAIDGTHRQRTAAAQKLMSRVFEHARKRRMNVILAVDMDTNTANPQALITRLPEQARFETQPGSGFWLARPDTAEGYGYYKAQLSHLLRVYPQLTTFVLWFRRSRTPMMRLKAADLPPPWRGEYQSIIAKKPGAEKYWHGVGMFVLSKVAVAHRKALKELGRNDVKLGLGSWGFDLQNAADLFMPGEVGLYPLDFEVLWKASRLESPGGPEGVARTAANRPVFPVHWAHHDDLTYVGPPYPPFEKFYDLLVRSRCETAGFGVLHWTTRPLDLYFRGLCDSVWASTQNQSLERTCRNMARDLWGGRHEDLFSRYLAGWLSGLPMIGRDTSDFFIDRELKGYEEALSTHKQRMALLDRIKPDALNPMQRRWVTYFRGLERFILSVFENESHYRSALKLHEARDHAGARAVLEKTDVPAAIRLYAETAELLGVSRGEQGLVVSLNTRWLTHYINLSQQLGVEPIRINFAPTSHDLLAQNRGRFTYFIDTRRRLWEVRGEAETGVAACGEIAGHVKEGAPADDPLQEVRRSGLLSGKPFRLRVSPLMNRKNQVVTAGKYRLTLFMGGAEGWAPRHNGIVVCVFDAAVHVPGIKEPLTKRIAMTQPVQNVAFKVTLPNPGIVEVAITPVKGSIRMSGLVFEPEN